MDAAQLEIVNQFPLLAAVAVICAALIVAFWRAWTNERQWRQQQEERRETWTAEQNAKREAAQAARDAQWREYLDILREAENKQATCVNETLSQLIEELKSISKNLAVHDQFSRNAFDAAANMAADKVVEKLGRRVSR